MKVRILLAALCLTALAPLPFMMEKAGAADGTVPGDQTQVTTPRLDRHLAYLTNTLALTAEQQALIKSILTAEADQLAEIRDSASSQEEKRGKLSAVRSATHTQIREVLTPDQQKKYEAPFEKAAKRRKVTEGTTPVPEQGK